MGPYAALGGRTVQGTIGIMGGVQEVPVPFVMSLSDMLQYNYEHALARLERVRVTSAFCSLHSAARNQLARDFSGAFLLMLDTDMVHQADAMCRLRRTMLFHDADVVSGVYYKTNPPHFPALWAWDAEDQFFREAMVAPDVQGPFRVDAAGAGILMLSRRVIERVKAEHGTDPFDIEPGAAKGHPPFGEDLSFFRKLLLLNPRPKVLCHPGVVSRHLRWQPVGPEDNEYELSKLIVSKDDPAHDRSMVALYDGQELDVKKLRPGA